MADLTIDGETFRVEVEGATDRPSVLLSNSLGTDLTLWDPQMPALLDRFRVVRYDSRGHGRSTAAGAPYALARLGADALAILDALAIDSAHFIGISMGGAVGQWLLVNAPERITRAVLANTCARFGTPDLWNGRIASVLSGGTASLAAATLERWFSEGFRKAEPGRVAAVEAAFRATSSEGYAGCCAALRDMDLREALPAVERPVLIVTGRDDPVASEADIAAMTGAIRGAQHVALACRHISNIEAAAAFNDAVVAFLAARPPTRVGRARTPRKHAAPARRPTIGRATAARRPLQAAASVPAAEPRARKPRAASSGAAAKASAGKRTATKRAPAKAATKTPRAVASRPAGKTITTRRTPSKRPAASKASGAPRSPAAVKKATAIKKPAAKKAPKKPTPPRRRPGKKRPGRPAGGRKR